MIGRESGEGKELNNKERGAGIKILEGKKEKDRRGRV